MPSFRNQLFAFVFIMASLPIIAHPGHSQSAPVTVASYLGPIPSTGIVVLKTSSADFWRKTFISKYPLGPLANRVSISWN